MTTYQPYVYQIGWTAIDKFYVGMKISNNKQRVANPSTFLTSYRTSSKLVHEFMWLFGQPDFVQVHSCESAEQAEALEEMILFYADAANSTRYLNKRSRGKFSKDGRFIPEESRQRMSENSRRIGLASKGKKQSPEVRAKRKGQWTGSKNPNYKGIYEYQGKTYCMSELAALTGIPRHRLRNRIVVDGWSVEDAINTPFDKPLIERRKKESK